MMPPAPGMTDVFPAFSLSGIALIKLMERIDPPPIIRAPVVGALALSVIGYLSGQLHLFIPDPAGLPAYGGLTVLAGGIIWWNWRDRRAADRN